MSKVNMQKNRGCRHEEVNWTKVDHPKYGYKIPYFVKLTTELSCNTSCGGR